MIGKLLLIAALVCIANPDGSVTVREVTATTGSSTTTTTTTSTSTTTLPYRTAYGGGYAGTYDQNGPTISDWPTKPGIVLIQGEANAQGPLVAQMKAAALAAKKPETRFLFYLSLTDMDSRCGCYDQQLYDSFRTAHPEWVLHDASGAAVSTNNGIGRVYATDIGNTAYVDAWIAHVLAATTRYGWDGVWADNVIRCNGFGEWSALPVNPRTHATYTCAAYRQDIVNALARIRAVLRPQGKIVVGNHSGAWHAASFADPLIAQEVALMDGVRVEDCVYDYSGKPHTEQEWIEQLAYMRFANSIGVTVQCEGASGTIGVSPQRDYVLATALLTKEKLSGVAELNTVGAWWPGLDVDLGAPRAGYECVSGASVVSGSPCAALGMVYRRRFAKGVVAVNPTTGARTVPLGQSTTTCGSSVTLGPQSGRVCP